MTRKKTLSFIKKTITPKPHQPPATIPYIPPEIITQILEILVAEKDFCTATCLALMNRNTYMTFYNILLRAITSLRCRKASPPNYDTWARMSLSHRARRELSVQEKTNIPRAVLWQGPPLWYLLQDFVGLEVKYCKKTGAFRKRSTLEKLGKLL
ncbi:hypothetical protein EG329_011170 [Mollisiaceae sp. DMI_Dod_QoI]|nr:hypothetical protein EG329_011170 [Helotiales sp. DMI_Dod_QoI]